MREKADGRGGYHRRGDEDRDCPLLRWCNAEDHFVSRSFKARRGADGNINVLEQRDDSRREDNREEDYPQNGRPASRFAQRLGRANGGHYTAAPVRSSATLSASHLSASAMDQPLRRA